MRFCLVSSASAKLTINKKCPECGAPFGDHFIGGSAGYHPRPVIKSEPSKEAKLIVGDILSYPTEQHSDRIAYALDAFAQQALESFVAGGAQSPVVAKAMSRFHAKNLEVKLRQARDEALDDVLGELSLRYTERSEAADAEGNNRAGGYLRARAREITNLEAFCRALKSPASGENE